MTEQNLIDLGFIKKIYEKEIYDDLGIDYYCYELQIGAIYLMSKYNHEVSDDNSWGVWVRSEELSDLGKNHYTESLSVLNCFFGALNQFNFIDFYQEDIPETELEEEFNRESEEHNNRLLEEQERELVKLYEEHRFNSFKLGR